MKSMRGYARRDRIAKASLAKHAARMAELEAEGVPHLEASRQAFQEMTEKQRASRGQSTAKESA